MSSVRLSASPLPEWDKTMVLCRDCVYFRAKCLMNSEELCMHVVVIHGGDKPEVLGKRIIGCNLGVRKEGDNQE